MQRIIQADKDCYITNKIVKGVSKISGNTGCAATLDLYKLYGLTFSGTNPNIEMTRLLIHFPIDTIRDKFDNSEINISDPTFWCKIKLRDVYGGQPTPSNFNVVLHPLSASFQEGLGRDVTFYSDRHVSNWLSSSLGVSWHVTGCNGPCYSTGSGDYITASSLLVSTECTQSFVSGEEDLLIDVTSIISATIAGDIPDQGFRISFSNTHESDTASYFVKRFGSRSVYDESKRPYLVWGFDDSSVDNTSNFYVNSTSSLFMYNYENDELKNIISGTSEISGDNCVLLRMSTPISGGTLSYYFTGSQHSHGFRGFCYVTGTYSARPIITDNTQIQTLFNVSGTIPFTPVWTSLDQSVTYMTGTQVRLKRSSKQSSIETKFDVVTVDMPEIIRRDTDTTRCQVFFSPKKEFLEIVKVPVQISSAIVNNAFYRIKNDADETVIDFDFDKNSTRLSSDNKIMYFDLHAGNLPPGRLYTIDIATVSNGIQTRYTNTSQKFRVI